LAEVATTTGFTREAQAALPASTPFVRALRERAYQEFEALPIPSQETEEWRYTDLSDLDLSFAPFTPGGGRARSLDEVPEDVQAVAGAVGDRSGLAIQLNSEPLIAHLATAEAANGVVFTDLDRAAEAPEHRAIVEASLHAAVPTERTKFTALHAAFRTGGTFVHVPEGVKVELPLESLTYLDTDHAAVFPHTLIVLEKGAELTFIDRYFSPDLERGLSDAVVEIHSGPGSRLRYVVLQEWGPGVSHLSVQRAHVGRDAEVR